MQKTAEALERRGHHVEIQYTLDPDCSGFDIVHVFNLTTAAETWETIKAIRRRSAELPIAISPVYFDWSEYHRHGHYGIRRILGFANTELIERMKYLWMISERPHLIGSFLRAALTGVWATRQRILEQVDLILPNSWAEKRVLESTFPGISGKCHVVYNGVDLEQIQAIRDYNYEREPDLVLCVARIDERKNQLRLVQALKLTGLRGVLIGDIAPRHKHYAARVLAEVSSTHGQVQYLGPIGHDKLVHWYYRAKIHALVSWLETPGLSSLEAAVAGCRIVVTDRGSTHEYFGNGAYYCEPGDVESIADAIQTAYTTPQVTDLATRIRSFTWERAANDTLSAYNTILSKARTCEAS